MRVIVAAQILFITRPKAQWSKESSARAKGQSVVQEMF
jgi:hypothetical protein